MPGGLRFCSRTEQPGGQSPVRPSCQLSLAFPHTTSDRSTVGRPAVGSRTPARGLSHLRPPRPRTARDVSRCPSVGTTLRRGGRFGGSLTHAQLGSGQGPSGSSHQFGRASIPKVRHGHSPGHPPARAGTGRDRQGQAGTGSQHEHSRQKPGSETGQPCPGNTAPLDGFRGPKSLGQA